MYLQQLSNDHKQHYHSATFSLFNKEHIKFRMFVVRIIFNIEKLKKEKKTFMDFSNMKYKLIIVVPHSTYVLLGWPGSLFRFFCTILDKEDA